MKIAIIMEGKTEKAFLPHLQRFLQSRLAGRMPRFDPQPYDGRIAKGEKLRKDVHLLCSGKNAADHVIALTDVYTGTTPPDFLNAQDAIEKMRQWVGSEPRFHPHAAQFEFEAWLLPYWPTIQKLSGHNKSAPTAVPEAVNHQNPPSRYLREIFEIGKSRDSYRKIRDAGRILRDNDLAVAIEQCPQLKALVNTILSICGILTIP